MEVEQALEDTLREIGQEILKTEKRMEEMAEVCEILRQRQKELHLSREALKAERFLRQLG